MEAQGGVSVVVHTGGASPIVRRVTPRRIELAMRVVNTVIEIDRKPTNGGAGDTIDSFLTNWLAAFSFHGWSDDAVRAVVRSVLENAPAEDCDAFLKALESDARWTAAELKTIEAEETASRRKPARAA